MRRSTTVLFTLLALAVPVAGQEQPTASSGETTYRNTPEAFALTFLTLSYDDRSVDVRFNTTDRLPGAEAKASVQQRGGVTAVEIELDEMKPAWSFGGDINTYVLWAVSPEGHIDALGELPLDGDRSELKATTRLHTFGLIVSAEPHFMVDRPSPFVVLVNREPNDSMRRPPETVRVELRNRPTYRYELESLRSVQKVDGRVFSALRQAHIAVHLAEAAGASSLAAGRLAEARESLSRAEGAAETRASNDPDVERMARRTVGLAAAAQRLAEGDTSLRTARR